MTEFIESDGALVMREYKGVWCAQALYRAPAIGKVYSFAVTSERWPSDGAFKIDADSLRDESGVGAWTEGNALRWAYGIYNPQARPAFHSGMSL
jgi:hypothetical protein